MKKKSSKEMKHEKMESKAMKKHMAKMKKSCK